MRLIQRLLSGLCALALSCVASAQNPVITIAAEDDWAPYSSMKADKSGPEGFSPDLVRAVFKLKGVNVQFVTVPFARCLQMVKTGKAVACFDTSITDENRDEFYWHKTPIVEEGLGIFALADYSGAGLTSHDLEGRSVGITTGYTYAAEFTLNTKIKKFEANSDDLLLKMLVARRVQFVIMNTMPGLLRIRNEPGMAGKVKQVGQIGIDSFWLNFSKVHPDGKRMAELFEEGLLAFKASGEYDRMQADLKRRLGASR